MLSKNIPHTTLKTAGIILFTTLAVTIVTLIAPIVYAAGTWTDGQAADVVLGQPDFTSNSPGVTASTLNNPRAAVVDPTTAKLFVSDFGNNRVLRFSSASAAVSGSAAEAVLGQADFVSNAPNRGGAVAANTMWEPAGLAVDSSGRLWVVEWHNHRILRFDNASSKATGADADGVLGQADFVSNAANRGGAVAANTLNFPHSAAFDTSGNLWVTDFTNNRVLRFNNAASKSNGASADGVLGQLDFTNNSSATTQSGFDKAAGITISSLGTLFVSDLFNHRVLRFDNAVAKANGANADGVLGQTNFTSIVITTTQSGLNFPKSVGLDSVGHLYVADAGNSRVVIFNNAAAQSNGANADNVLGQSDFTTGTANTGGISASTLFGPREPFYDEALNVLWVTDTENHRALRYTPAAAATTATGVTSSANPSVFGQSVTFTATVTSGGGTPIGAVQFKVDGNNLGSPVTLVSGSATSQAISSLTVGNHTVTALYNGGTGFSPSTGTLSGGQTVNQANTTTTITSHTPNPSIVGQSVLVTFTVSVTAPGSGTPTGNVTVSDGTVNCSATVAVGSCSLTFNTIGSKTLTATYAGDSNFNGSTSAGVSHQVNRTIFLPLILK